MEEGEKTGEEKEKNNKNEKGGKWAKTEIRVLKARKLSQFCFPVFDYYHGKKEDNRNTPGRVFES